MVVALVIAAIMGWNYVVTGLFEITPQDYFFVWRNDATFRQWMDPIALRLQIVLNEGSLGINWSAWQETFQQRFLQTLRADGIVPNGTAWLVLGAGAGALILVTRKDAEKKKASTAAFPGLRFTLGPVLAYLLFLVLLNSIIDHASLHRYSGAATTALIACTYGIAWAAISEQVCRLTLIRGEPARNAAALLMMMVPAPAVYKGFHHWNYDFSLPFVKGKVGYQEFIAGTWPEIQMCAAVKRGVPPNSWVKSFNVLLSCTAMPGIRFQRPLDTDYIPSMGTIMYGSPDAAMAALKGHQINHFHLDPGQALDFIAFSPLFEPESLRSRFKVFLNWDDAYFVLTWREPGDAPLPAPVVDKFKALLAGSQEHGYAKIYMKVKAEYLGIR